MHEKILIYNENVKLYNIFANVEYNKHNMKRSSCPILYGGSRTLNNIRRRRIERLVIILN
ncbi:hypothetical protein T10_7347 [Trichinella papuae]|uniref:Uncharacterized protein n=1 Tax=Trichinella papuae TaxID=268474 RepID=A0A0V1MWP9_9BILA|nr:hypothetical protein T10_7347 [Trichinella papuae]